MRSEKQKKNEYLMFDPDGKHKKIMMQIVMFWIKCKCKFKISICVKCAIKMEEE